jgi:hypothetical protein
MTRNQAFPSNYLSKEDVLTPLIVTIDHVTQEELDGDAGKKLKAILHFIGEIKPWVIPNCSWMEIEVAYGPESDDWHGKQIELFCDPSVMFGNKRVGGIRCRMPLQRPQAAQRGPARPAPIQQAQRAPVAPVQGQQRGQARRAPAPPPPLAPEPESFDGDPVDAMPTESEPF